MTTTKTIVVVRNGSNAANQSRRQQAPVWICEAASGEEAKQQARDAGVICYNNQHLGWMHASRCKASVVQEAREAKVCLLLDQDAWTE